MRMIILVGHILNTVSYPASPRNWLTGNGPDSGAYENTSRFGLFYYKREEKQNA